MKFPGLVVRVIIEQYPIAHESTTLVLEFLEFFFDSGFPGFDTLGDRGLCVGVYLIANFFPYLGGCYLVSSHGFFFFLFQVSFNDVSGVGSFIKISQNQDNLFRGLEELLTVKD